MSGMLGITGVTRMMMQMPKVVKMGLSKTAASLGRVKPQHGRMFLHQKSLARLPIPPLQQTLYRYLLSVEPLLSKEDFETTKKVVEDFGKPNGVGQRLQMALVKRAKKLDNWLSQWWLSVAYLEFRSPVVVNVSPGIVCPRENINSESDQLKFASKFISGVLDFKHLIDTNSLPVDQMGGQPLCMDQYYKVLAACRIPGPRKDDLVFYPPNKPDAPKHIIVAHKNHFYTVDVMDKEGVPLTLSQLYSQLKFVLEASTQPEIPVGLLTTAHRNTWGKVYKRLNKDPTNAKSFDNIKRAIFLLCLDSSSSQTEQNFSAHVARQALYGGGSGSNSGNRWYDKTIQFFVSPNGGTGLTYEHSGAEGPPIISLVDHTLAYAHSIADDFNAMTVDAPAPKKLNFNLDLDALDTIEEAKQEIDSLAGDLQLTILPFKHYGKDFPKSQKLSPDAFIQIAIQLTYYKIYGRSAATYESASLRKYQYGRTDTIRSASIASNAFCKAMEESGTKPSEKAMLFRKAILSHKEYTNLAINGDGIDRHLLGLKLIAIEQGENVPDLFMDTAYTQSSHFNVSTSQVPAKHDLVMCFGPVVPDGYGICYNPRQNHLNFAVSAFNTSPETDSDVFAKRLSESLLEIRDVLESAPPTAKL
ncbi:carnitine O-acetyltransferase-like isoform X2 [Amphiura filiformis]|uniref:carnitine O-acetyltransferase-like isoform X2 n=1 Tax=Amphiura filiformis TaxID=82378 RepID=UPI003B212139